MDVDQMKLIADLLRDAGAGTKEVIIAWMLCDMVKPVVVSLSVAVALLIAMKGLWKGVGSLDNKCRAWRTVCDAADMDPMPCVDGPTSAYVHRVIRRIREKAVNLHIEQHRAEQKEG